MSPKNPLREPYKKLMARVAQAAERVSKKPEDIITIAVTKTASPDQIRQLLELGHSRTER